MQHDPFPRTEAMRRALSVQPDLRALPDLVFLEGFEMNGTASVAAVLRAHQIRRANPTLAADLRAELSGKTRPHA